MSKPARHLSHLLFFIVLFIVTNRTVSQRNTGQQQVSSPVSYEKQMLDRLINNNQQYDPLVRPTVKNSSEPTEISIHVTVQNMGFLEPMKNEYKVHLLMTQEWEDTRLSYAQLNPPKKLRYLTVLDPTKIWKPDISFWNEKNVGRASSDKQEHNFARISPAGKVTLVIRISATLSCPVNIRLFPFDSQKCPMKLASAAFTREDVVLKWKNPANPIDVKPDFSLAPGMAYHSTTNDMSDSQTETGVYSCLVGGFIFNRLKGHYWKQLYIPCTSLVLLGWLSFFLDATGIPGIVRVILVIITWTTAYLNISEFHHAMPKVAYSTAFDVWTGMCLAFIFVSVIGMIFSTYMANHGHTKIIPPERIQALEAKRRLGEISAQFALQQRSSCLSASFVLDRILIFAYPILFLAFAAGYFTVYLKVARLGFEALKD